MENNKILDTLSNDDTLHMLESAIPFINTSAQKSLAIFIKTYELQNIITNFNNAETLSACGLDKPNGSIEDMLKAMRATANKKYSSQIDMILNIINATNLYKTYNEQLKKESQKSNTQQNNNNNANNNNNNSNNNANTNNNSYMELISKLLDNQNN